MTQQPTIDELLAMQQRLMDEVTQLRRQLAECSCRQTTSGHTADDHLQLPPSSASETYSPRSEASPSPRGFWRSAAEKLIGQGLHDHEQHGSERWHKRVAVSQAAMVPKHKQAGEYRPSNAAATSGTSSDFHVEVTDDEQQHADAQPEHAPIDESSDKAAFASAESAMPDTHEKPPLNKQASTDKWLRRAKKRPVWTILRHIYLPPPEEFDYGFERPLPLLKKMMPSFSELGPPPVNLFLAAYAAIGGFIATLCIAFVGQDVGTDLFDFSYSYHGATVVMLFCMPQLNAASPRNMMIGHFICAMVAVVVSDYIVGPENSNARWLSPSLSIGASIFLMQITGTANPPSAAAALLYSTSSEEIQRLGFLYVANVLIGNAILVGIALVLVNLPRSLKYPKYWI